MKFRLTPRAFGDPAQISKYISEEQQQPRVAEAVIQRIEGALDRIKNMPYIGKESYIKGSRELTISNLPYCIVYRVVADTIEITTVFHEAQNPDKKLSNQGFGLTPQTQIAAGFLSFIIWYAGAQRHLSGNCCI